jgi:hypothetical protein
MGRDACPSRSGCGPSASLDGYDQSVTRALLRHRTDQARAFGGIARARRVDPWTTGSASGWFPIWRVLRLDLTTVP